MDSLIHGVKKFRISRHFPDNDNSITIEIQGCGSYQTHQTLTLFGLPKSITDKLMLGFADAETTISKP